jgi:hypothetical protein
MLSTVIRSFAAWLAAFAFLVPAFAAEVSAADARGVKSVVQAQLSAFAADDARKAFSFAAPNIRQLFSTPDKFMAMVRAQYPMVHRPASVAFLKPEADGESVIQRVQMTDSAGSPWLVTYLLQRQKDKSWRISACVVAAAPSRLTT